jgi:hypothetical protein
MIYKIKVKRKKVKMMDVVLSSPPWRGWGWVILE